MNPKYFLLLLCLAAACAKPLHKSPYPEIIPQEFTKELPLDAAGQHTVNVLYLGCGNMILEKDGEAVVTDPFFSNQPVLKLAGKIRSHNRDYDRWKKMVEPGFSPSVVKAGLVAHTHYDHVMDLPLLVSAHYFPQMKKVYGNPYLPKMLQNFREEGVDFVGLQGDQLYDPVQTQDTIYQWIQASPSIRFLPILSNHAPHIGRKLFMSDSLKESVFARKFKEPFDKVSAFKWTVGETYSFLVDFLGSDTLRVFIQTSASQAPRGLPPLAELNQKRVDVAILCYACTPNVDDYPKLLYEVVQPQKIILVHWEDFFRRPKSPSDVKLVRGTNPKKVKKRFDALKPDLNNWVMPKPGTQIVIRY